MKRWGTILALLGLWLLPGKTVARTRDQHIPDKDRYGYFLTGNRGFTRIPFQLHSNLIIIPLRVNDSDTLRFILDTGLNATIITDPNAFKNHSNRTTRRVKLSGAGEGANLTAAVAIDNSLSMGHMRGNHQNLVILDTDILKLSEYVGVPVHGIFGYDLFNNFVVTIDFQQKEIMLELPNRYKYRKSKGDRYPIIIQDTKPYIDVVSVVDNGKTTPLRVVLDTGAGHALLLDRSRTVDQMPLPEKIIRAQLGRGLNGVINGSMGRIQTMRLGKYEMTNILASFPDSTSFGMKLSPRFERQGNIGCELLRRFKVTFNYQENYIVLKPVRKIMKETFEHDMSGLELRAKGDQFRNYFIDRILDGSPAYFANLREGDELIFINNTAAAELTISDIYKMLQKGEGKEVSLMVRRNGQVLFTQFALKRLI